MELPPICTSQSERSFQVRQVPLLGNQYARNRNNNHNNSTRSIRQVVYADDLGLVENNDDGNGNDGNYIMVMTAPSMIMIMTTTMYSMMAMTPFVETMMSRVMSDVCSGNTSNLL